MLEDEIELLQYGIEDEFEFYRVNYGGNGPSFMNKWPTKEEPDNKYKFASVWFELSQDEIKIERQTYSILEWLGDVGGLVDAFRYIGVFLLSPLADFVLKQKLV